MLSSERWERVKRVFDAAADRDPEERSAFLDAACAEDHALRQEVESLLEAHTDDDEFLADSAGSVLALADGDGEPGLIGRVVGSYRLLRLVGSGGMGVVYEAERADQAYEKRVAVKLIKRGMDTDRIIRRFRQERQILAALDHPNIAGLLDGGVTGDGQPYLVMEYVDGVPIHKYCAAKGLPVRERIALFRDVCAAVHFAHQNLVVHRDLKPGNILVRSQDEVRLLDFGVAKLLRPDAMDTVPLTEAGARILTPAYASPEQVRGETVTTASDIYSLGVILYELLAGRRPFEFEGSSLEEVARIVGSEMPTRPSAAIGSHATLDTDEAGVRALRRRLEGELDNIVLMAMRKEPERRYASAAALSDDLGRYLEGRPVLAQKDTAGYRIRKFVQRHKAAVVAAGLVAASLVMGVAATAWQARRAEAARSVAESRFDDVRALTNTLIFEVHDAVADLPGAMAARDLIVSRAFEFLDRLAEEGERDRDLSREVAEGYIRLGLVQGQPTGASRGDLTAARLAYLRAMTIAENLVRTDPGDNPARRTLALAHEKLGDVEAWTGDPAAGVVHARAALNGFAALARASPDSERDQLSRAISHVKLGDLLGHPVFPNVGDTDGAQYEYTAALELLERPPLAGSADWGTRRYVGLVRERLGTMLRLDGRWSDALQLFGRSLVIREELLREAPRSVEARRDVAVTLQNVCEMQRELGELGAAGSSCGRARELLVELHEADSDNVQAVDDLARFHRGVAELRRAAGRFDDAATELEVAVDLRERLLESHPENILNQRELIGALLALASHHAGLILENRSPRAAAAARAKSAHERARALIGELDARGIDAEFEESLRRAAAEALAAAGIR